MFCSDVAATAASAVDLVLQVYRLGFAQPTFAADMFGPLNRPAWGAGGGG
jgi:hypothetical protein